MADKKNEELKPAEAEPKNAPKSAGEASPPEDGAKGTTDAGQAEVQEKFDEMEEKGYLGVKLDPTPNENYTVAGVLANLPRPETDADLKKAAAERSEAIANGEQVEEL